MTNLPTIESLVKLNEIMDNLKKDLSLLTVVSPSFLKILENNQKLLDDIYEPARKLQEQLDATLRKIRIKMG